MKVRIILVAAIVASLATTADASTIAYSVTDLGTLPGGNSSVPASINNSGQVAGASGVSGVYSHAFFYSGGVMQDLGTLPHGGSSAATGLNGSGKVVGYADSTDNTGQHAFLYSGGVMHDIGNLGGYGTQAESINSAGQVVGTSTLPGNVGYHAFLYSGGSMQDLGTLVPGGGAESIAYAINDNGQIAGGADFRATQSGFHAFRYSGGQMYDLGTLGGTYSNAFGIDSAGDVLGGAQLSGDMIWHAYVYTNGIMHDLSTTDPNSSSFAYSINASGQIVGYGGFSNHGLLFAGGTATDLNSLIDASSGWLIGAAYSINDAGEIIGEGYVPSDNYAFKHAYLLAPVPEPSSLALAAIAALSVIGMLASSRPRAMR